MSDRTPAGEKGTADRIEADDGGYWVRLVTKQALRREGVCMGNCLDSQGHGQETAGEEEMVSTGLWSLRKADGLSHMLASVHVQRTDVFVGNAAGPKNNQPSGWCCRQLRHLVNAFLDAGTVLRIPDAIALTGEDGRTWRPDKAPQDVKDAAAARRKAEDEKKAESRAMYRNRSWDSMTLQNGAAVVLRGEPDGAEGSFRSIGSVRAGHGDPELSAMETAVQHGLVTRGEILRSWGIEWEVIAAPTPAENAIAMAMEQGIVTSHEVSPSDGESVTIRPRGRLDEILTPNGDGTYAMQLGNYTYHRVMPTGDLGFGLDYEDTVKVRIAPPSRRPSVPLPETPEEERELLVAEITRVEERLATGIGMHASEGVAHLERLYRRLEGLGGPPVQRGRVRFVMAPGALMSTRLGPGIITP